MGGAGDVLDSSPNRSPDKEDDQHAPPPPEMDVEDEEPWPLFSDPSFCLADAPILLLVYFHRALRAELANLRRLVIWATESNGRDLEMIENIRRRFDFLKLAYKYHCAAEDEVVFMALDMHIKNVACTYSLEHKCIDDLFDFIFRRLNELEESRHDLKPLQELVYGIHNLGCSICQHMLKEEEQVFPLLMKQFSAEQQASLVWQFICSIPIVFLKDLLPWMMSFLCPDKKADVMHCIREIIPEESVQEVVISWIDGHDEFSSGALTKISEGTSEVSADMKSILQLQPSKPNEEHQQGKKTNCVQINTRKNLLDNLHLWHGAIQADLQEILEELYQIGSSSSSSKMDFIVLRIKFLADIVIFYSNAVKKFFYPVLNELGNNHFYSSSIEKGIESLHKLLQSNAQAGFPLSNFVKKICRELESFVIDIGKQFNFQETEVIPLISRNCSHESQLQLLYMSLHVMPLGLLRCAVTWFASHLSETESRSILRGIDQGDFLPSKSFASLLVEWFHIGYSGKTTIENLGKDLQNIFKSRCSVLPDQIKESVGCYFVNIQSSTESEPSKLESESANKDDKFLSCSSSSGSTKAKRYETSYFSEVNLHVLFPETVMTPHPLLKLPADENRATSITNKPKPIDVMFFFHKAFKKDLDYIVSCSAELSGNLERFVRFCRHFYLFQFCYKFHSDAEDEIAFPALEEKGKVQNISRSYSIDHKLGAKHFSKVCLCLDEMSKLHSTVSTVGSNMQDQRMEKYDQLCMKVHHMCKSMHSLISHHVHREEIELWPLFRECLSIQEQEKIIGHMLGRAKAETLQDVIPWLMGSLTPEEQHTMMSLWRNVTKNTMFDQWLAEWWGVYNTVQFKEDTNNSCSADPLEIISNYLFVETLETQDDISCEKNINFSEKDSIGADIEKIGKLSSDDRANGGNGDQNNNQCSECKQLPSAGPNKRSSKVDNAIDEIHKPAQPFHFTLKSRHYERLLTISQDDVDAAIRRVSRDSSLDPQKRSHIIQNLQMSRWIVQQLISQAEETNATDGEEIPGQHPSYRDPVKLTMGCKHYKRNCKLLTSCCNQLHTCLRCHDEVADHSADRRTITKMMCMRCLKMQPIGRTCSTISCNNLSMGRYFCRICKLFDDDREIYHCPYCNLCRLGKGLGIEYFHCMNCNACMSKYLFEHTCREKYLEDNCPICHEYIFTSSNPVKALPCGHLMHSTCFQEYTFTHYTCPICSKSLGDMQVYFMMLDALLAEEKIPDEYCGRIEVILCNDCEKKGEAPFHWLYHKCPHCGSYNTRVV